MGRTEMPDYLERSDSGNDLEADQVISYVCENEKDQPVTNFVIKFCNKTHNTSLIMPTTFFGFILGKVFGRVIR
jgi:hypothetical protein